jgi:hypothetical protein
MEFTVGMSNRIRNELFQTKYPEFEIVAGHFGSLIRVKNGTASMLITDAFFLMALNEVSIDDILRDLSALSTNVLDVRG